MQERAILRHVSRCFARLLSDHDCLRSMPEFVVCPPAAQVIHDCWFVKPSDDVEAWTNLIRRCEEHMTTRSSVAVDLDVRHPLHDRLQELVPWRLTKVQMCRVPKQRRWPLDIDWHHRGCALRMHSGEAISALRCDTCLRKTKPGQPLPATMPTIRQFSDHVLMDIVYVSDL
eukprot:2639584-Amphidinium_carterae.2